MMFVGGVALISYLVGVNGFYNSIGPQNKEDNSISFSHPIDIESTSIITKNDDTGVCSVMTKQDAPRTDAGLLYHMEDKVNSEAIISKAMAKWEPELSGLKKMQQRYDDLRSEFSQTPYIRINGYNRLGLKSVSSPEIISISETFKDEGNIASKRILIDPSDIDYFKIPEVYGILDDCIIENMGGVGNLQGEKEISDYQRVISSHSSDGWPIASGVGAFVGMLTAVIGSSFASNLLISGVVRRETEKHKKNIGLNDKLKSLSI